MNHLLLLVFVLSALMAVCLGQPPQQRSYLPGEVAAVHAARLFKTNPKEGLKAAQVAVESLLEQAGPDDARVVEPLNMLSRMYYQLHGFDKAVSYGRKALESAIKTSDAESMPVGKSAESLGLALLGDGRAQESLPYLHRAIDIFEAKNAFMSHTHCLVTLGGAYGLAGEYAMAESLTLQGRQRAQEVKFRMPPGQAEQFVSRANSSLGSLYASMGDHERAYDLQRYNLRSARLTARGGDTSQLTMRLSSYARTCGKVKKYEEGLEILAEAAQLIRQSQGDNSPQLAMLHIHRSSILVDQKKYAEALEELDRADTRMSAASAGKNHSQRSLIDNNRGYILILTGRSKDAEPFIQASLKSQLTQKDDPFGLATTHGSLARIQALQGRADPALRNLHASSKLIESQLLSLQETGSDQQKVAFLNKAAGKVELALDLLFVHLPEHPGIRKEVFETVLARKGRAMDLSRAVPAAPGNRPLQSLIESRNQLLGTISGQALRSALGDPKPATRSLASQQFELESTSRKLRQMAAKPPAAKAFTLKNLAQTIPEQAAYVDYVVYRQTEDKNGLIDPDARPWVCAAFVVQRDQSLTAVQLGPLSAIETQARALRAALSRPGDDRWKPPARSLHQLLIEPLHAATAGKTRWIISPDGILNLLPFSTFIDANGQALLRTHEITYVGSGRELLQPPAPKAPFSAVAFADPIYTIPDSADPSILNFAPLPGTAEEARAIQAIIPAIKSHLKGQANEVALKSVQAPTILHIATHGFFLDSAPGGEGSRGLKRKQPPGDPEQANKTSGAGRLSFRLEENPLIRSGLAFSGANQLTGGRDEDGVLTALEASRLNLQGTRLIVLSACETGVGEVMNGEGVFGLRRAFQLAGAKSQVLSLWKVDDRATAQLMADFYKQLSKGTGKSTALHNAATAIANDTKYAHPNYWAAFILSGHAGPL